MNTFECYNGQIYDMRQKGATLQEIGDATNRTRERIRQILVEHYGDTKIKSYLTTLELSSLTHLSLTHIRRLRLSGVIVPIYKGKQFLWGIDTLKFLLGTDHRKVCKICGAHLPVGRTTYCSDECAQKGNRLMCSRVTRRRLRRKLGQPLTPSCAYTYPNRSPYIRKGKEQ